MLPLATLAALAAAGAARADLIDFSLVPDGVYTSQSAYQDWLSNQTSTDILSTATITGQTVNLPRGTTSAYVSMAIVATINNPSRSTPISSDGVAWAFLNLVGTTTGNMGTGILENPNGAAAEVNNGSLVGNQTGQANPGANAGGFGNTTQYWQTLVASPVQAYAGTSTKSSSSGWYKKPIEWPENFATVPGATGGVNTSPMVIGYSGTAAETSIQQANNFAGIYMTPTVPSSARLVTYSSPTAFTVGSTTAANGTAIQPGSAATGFLQGASGITAASATFILGEVDYNFSGASSGTTTINATPANLSAIAGGSNADFLVNGTLVQSAYLTATSGTTGTVTGSGPPVKISLAGSTYWNGAGLTSALSNPANWINGLPAAGTELDFGPMASGGSATPNNDSLAWSSTTSTTGIRFLGTSLDGVNSAAYTLTGNPLVLTGAINNDSTNNQVLNLNITLATGAGTISTVTNSVTVNGVISSSGAIGITKMRRRLTHPGGQQHLHRRHDRQRRRVTVGRPGGSARQHGLDDQRRDAGPGRLHQDNDRPSLLPGRRDTRRHDRQ